MNEMTEAISKALRDSGPDPGKFARFYREHADSLVGYFMQRTSDAEVSIDLAAETLARAFLKRETYRGSTDAAAGAWLYTIASRQLSSYLRRRKVEQKALQRLGLERTMPIPDADLRLAERESIGDTFDRLHSEVARLPSAQREVVELRFFCDLPYSDIAKRLGISEGAARARLMRALNGLRKVFQPSLTKEEVA